MFCTFPPYARPHPAFPARKFFPANKGHLFCMCLAILNISHPFINMASHAQQGLESGCRCRAERAILITHSVRSLCGQPAPHSQYRYSYDTEIGSAELNIPQESQQLMEHQESRKSSLYKHGKPRSARSSKWLSVSRCMCSPEHPLCKTFVWAGLPRNHSAVTVTVAEIG